MQSFSDYLSSFKSHKTRSRPIQRPFAASTEDNKSTHSNVATTTVWRMHQRGIPIYINIRYDSTGNLLLQWPRGFVHGITQWSDGADRCRTECGECDRCEARVCCIVNTSSDLYTQLVRNVLIEAWHRAFNCKYLYLNS